MRQQKNMVKVVLEINGQSHSLLVEREESLLDTLRNRLSLLGAKRGCEEGVCGACTVIVQGKARRSCRLKTAQLEGATVRTIESLSEGESLHPLQSAFIEEGAVGCGFCTPGMIMSTLALIEQNPVPDLREIKRALQPNLCRCSGYWPAIRAVQRATGQPVKLSRQHTGVAEPMRVVGRTVLKADAVAKVNGQATFGADIQAPDLAHAVLIRSPYAHARLLHIDSSPAMEIPGVLAVLTADDIPGENAFGKNVADQPILATDVVRYRGQPVALVVAETREVALRAAEKVYVQYEVLPAVLTAEEAAERDWREDVLHHIEIRKGDVERGFGQASVTVERIFRTQRTDALFLEPPAGVAEVDEDGTLLLHAACQYPYGMRQQVARALALSTEQVRIVQVACGGAFGAKVESTIHLPLAVAAWRLRRPVKMVLSRDEVFLSVVKRHPMILKYRVGAEGDGKLSAMQIEIMSDTGAFETSGVSVLMVACHDATGPYDVPNVQVNGTVYRTNQVPSGAQRGFGVPQVAFAYESIMDELAAELGLSPLQIRERNAVTAGSTLVSGQKLQGAVPAHDTLFAVLSAIPRQVAGEKCRGSGLALTYKSVGYSGGVDNVARTAVEVGTDGRIIVRSGGLEMGQGSDTVLAQIAAEELNVGPAQVDVQPFDTAAELDSCSTEASRFTISSGRALLEATSQLRGQLLDAASEVLGVATADLILDEGRVWEKSGGRSLSFGDLALYCSQRDRSLAARGEIFLPVPRKSSSGPLSAVDTTFCAAKAEVEIDPRTGALDVLSITLAIDVGRAINPLNVQVQVEGGALMGLGFATSEDLKWDAGVTDSIKLATYRIPRANNVPRLQTIIVEQPGQVGPYGAKGIGELPCVPIAPAIANAVFDATGIRVTELPITREKLRAALQGRAAGGR
jgi:CO/xanthine dehydrogenase Mo-binding subunit/aerobic-type carbon monoxide dehydrogenase small subunit (CoxS/CutS family)